MTTPRVLHDDDRLTVVTQPAGRWSLVGLASLAALFLTAHAVATGWTVWVVVGFVVAVLLSLGAFTLAHVTELDRAAGTYRTGWMSLGWWRSRSGPLDGLGHLALAIPDTEGLVVLFARPGRGAGHVWVTGEGMHVDAVAARRIGIEVSEFTGLDLMEAEGKIG